MLGYFPLRSLLAFSWLNLTTKFLKIKKKGKNLNFKKIKKMLFNF